ALPIWLVVGWVGASRGVSGSRIAIDLALSWALVGASVIALERVRWRRPRILLAVAALALLAADLQWTRSDVLWTLGFVLEAAWVAVLVHVVTIFPEGRFWSRTAFVVAVCAYGTVLGGQLVRALVLSDSRDGLSITSDGMAHPVARTEAALGAALALMVAVLAVHRLRDLHGPAWRAQAPLLTAAVGVAAVAAIWLGWVSVTGTGFPVLQKAARGTALLLPLGVVAGIAWSRLRRPEAADLVVELRTGGSDSLRERLGRILGDPTLDLVYRLDDGRYVDADGNAREVLEEPNRAITVVAVQGREIASLVHDPGVLDEPRLVEQVRATAGLVLENERLAAEVRAQLAEVRASRSRLVAATDSERRRLERDLHDGAQQRLVTLSVTLGLAAARGQTDVADVLERAQREVEHVIAELREFARGIHPTLLRDEGLDSAVAAAARRAPLPVAVHGSAGGRLPDPVELAAYFLVSEALTNIVKHAAAEMASVHLERRAGT